MSGPLETLIDLQQSLDRALPRLNRWVVEASYNQGDDPEGRERLLMTASELLARVNMALQRFKQRDPV